MASERIDCMEHSAKGIRCSFLVLFGIALVTALVGRAGLALMDATGLLTYDYIAASTGTLLNQVCTVLTGPTFFAFLFAAGLVLTTSTVGVAWYGMCYATGSLELSCPKYTLACGAATTAASLVCLLVFATGIMSPVQVAAMKTKLVIDGGVVLAAVLFLVAIITLLAAACQVVCACVARADGFKHAARNLLGAAAICGTVVMLFAVAVLASFNVAVLDGMACSLWLGLSAAANLAMLGAAAVWAKGNKKEER